MGKAIDETVQLKSLREHLFKMKDTAQHDMDILSRRPSSNRTLGGVIILRFVLNALHAGIDMLDMMLEERE